jgi:hypothetical protein
MRDFGFTLEMALRHRIFNEASTSTAYNPSHLANLGVVTPMQIQVNLIYSHSHLGVCFVEACRKPRGANGVLGATMWLVIGFGIHTLLI